MATKKRPAEVVATGVGAAGAVLILQFLRSAFPDWLWADETADTYLVAIVAWATGPVWAWVKSVRATGVFITLLGLAVLGTGCQILPNGTIVPDKDVIGIFVDLYKEHRNMENETEQAEREIEQQHQARVQRLAAAAWYAVDLHTKPGSESTYARTFAATSVWYQEQFSYDLGDDIRLLFDKPKAPEADTLDMFVNLLDRFLEKESSK